MTPERWQQIKDLLATALEKTPAERIEYLDQSCTGDVELRSEIELLLHSEAELGSDFLDHAALAETAAALLPQEDNPWIGRRVGNYQIVEQIGAGGMGEVYRAFRADREYRKDVALKVIRAGHDSTSVITRFKNERQILAGLDHPNIARLLDGGTTDGNTPYLVMELIEGQAIEEYCDAQKLSIPERLKLFVQVGTAVQYAHQRLIIHRDIKPGNILVTSDGVPKLLDFGIAKVLGSDLQPRRNETLTAFRILTPEYASPEQIKGEPVTTASDIYSLGVVLHTLLTGRSPYPSNARTSQELAAAIAEREPDKPSAVIIRQSAKNDDGAVNGEQIAARRACTLNKLQRQLRGDLDNIVLMALRKEPTRRYASAEQFAADIRRHLERIPVLARKDTPAYRMSKFVGRHRTAVAASAVALLAIFAGLVFALYEGHVARQQAAIARAERLRAEVRFNDVRSLANSLIFDVHDSIKELPGSTPARKIIVERSLQYLNVLAKESAGDLGLQRELAAAYEKVGSVQGDYLENNLGDSEGALASYQEALEILKQIDGKSGDWNDRLALARGYRLVAHQQWATGNLAGARQQIDRAIAISESLSQAHRDNPNVLYELGFDHEVSGTIGYPGDRSERQKTVEDFRRALAADEAAVRGQPADVHILHAYATDLKNIGGFLEATDPRAALPYYQKALEINRRLTESSTEIQYARSVAVSYGQIASVYDDLGDFSHALENNKKGLEMYRDLVRADPKNALLRQGLAIAYVNTATAWARVGNLRQGLEDSSRGLEMMRSVAASAPKNAYQRSLLAAMLAARGTILTAAKRPEAAITELQNARSVYESLSGPGGKHTEAAACDVKLGEAATLAGLDQRAAEYFHQALAIVEPSISTDPDLDSLYAAADAYSGLGRLSATKARKSQTAVRQRSHWAEARIWYVRSLETWRRIEHPNHTAPNSFQVGDPATAAKELKLVDAEIRASARADN